MVPPSTEVEEPVALLLDRDNAYPTAGPFSSYGQPMNPSEVSVFLAGDLMITRPWSHVREPAFANLIEQIRRADVAIGNLETVIHEFKGHAQANSGGVYMASPPQIADELKWAGFDMLAHANNHAFDYGAMGVLETLQHAESAGLIIAGSGRDLQSARAPRYFQCNGSTVALVSMASDFVRYGKASPSRPDLHGRPGVNPLTIRPNRRIVMPLKAVDRLRTFYWRHRGFPGPSKSVEFGDHHRLGAGADPADLDANLAAVSEAKANADIVVVSIHAHRQGRWLRDFAHQIIDRGAHIVFIHGPHRVLGIDSTATDRSSTR